ncbi:MAG: hypothetical protein WD023_08200 [Ilumatobacteraceae bacterium]
MFDQDARDALEALKCVDIDGCDAVALADAVRLSSRVRSFLDGIDLQLATRAETLHEQGKCARPAELMAKHGKRSAKDGRRTERRSKVAKRMPGVSDALSSGAISGDHTDALANAAGKLTDDQREALFAMDEELAEVASRSTPERFADHCQGIVIKLQADEGADQADDQRRQTKLTKYVDPRTGLYHLAGVFDPITGATIFKALDDETRAIVYAKDDADLGAIVPSMRTEWDHVAAHAFANLVRGGRAKRSSTDAEIIVLIDAQTITDGPHDHSRCHTTDGHDVPVASARRLLCTAVQRLTIVGASGEVLDLGTASAQPNRAQRRALQAMYRTCAWDGCDVAFSRCEIHHLHFRRFGGPTDLDNLAPLCIRHHHMVHEGRWSISLVGPERTLRINRPDGVHHADAPLRGATCPTSSAPPGSRPGTRSDAPVAA